MHASLYCTACRLHVNATACTHLHTLFSGHGMHSGQEGQALVASEGGLRARNMLCCMLGLPAAAACAQAGLQR